jgi:putative transposase
MGNKRGRRVSESDKIQAVELIIEASSNGCRIKVSCYDLEIDFKTFQSWREDPVDKRQGPITVPRNKLSDEERDEIVRISNSTQYMDYSPWVIVAKLADENKYIASESTFYKVLKDRKQLEHRGKSKPANKYRPAPLVAHGPNEIWSWDITYLKTMIRGEFYYVYLMMDIWSRRIVGFDIRDEESMEHSSKLMRKLCEIEGVKNSQLVLHSDNGGPMKGATMLATLEKLGVAASFSRPRVSNDNPYSESLFKTLKYCPKYPDRFEGLDEAKNWMMLFMSWYNNHPHSGIKFVTPMQRHLGLDKEILENRKKVYRAAKLKNPERWNNRKTRNWEREEKVYLNYLQKKRDVDINIAS